MMFQGIDSVIIRKMVLFGRIKRHTIEVEIKTDNKTLFSTIMAGRVSFHNIILNLTTLVSFHSIGTDYQHMWSA